MSIIFQMAHWEPLNYLISETNKKIQRKTWLNTTLGSNPSWGSMRDSLVCKSPPPPWLSPPKDNIYPFAFPKIKKEEKSIVNTVNIGLKKFALFVSNIIPDWTLIVHLDQKNYRRMGLCMKDAPT